MTRRKMIIIGSSVLIAILGLFIWWKQTGFYTVTIVNIANFQSQLEPFDNTSAGGERERLGGAAHLAAAVRDLEKKYPSLIVTESGDLVLGLWWRMWRGEPEFRVMSQIGVQVGALGNHEFNSGLDKFKEAVVEHATFPLLGTNIDFVYDAELAGRIKKHVIITDKGGVKVGFFSLVPPRLTFMAKIDREVSIDPDLAAEARRAVRELEDQGAEAVILISHASLEEDLALAEQVEGLSLIINGDGHYGRGDGLTWVEGPGGRATPVVVGDDNGRGLTLVSLTLQRGRTVREKTSAEMVKVFGDVEPDPEVQALLAEYNDRIDHLLSRPTGSFSEPVDVRRSVIRSGESAFGNFLTDAIRQRTGAKVAVLTAGDIRGDRVYPAGPFSIRTVMEILPFQNEIIIKELTGKEIRLMIDLSASALTGEDDLYDTKNRVSTGGFLHVSGLRASLALYAINQPALVDDDGRIQSLGNRVKSLGVEEDGLWTSLNDNETYTVAMTDFLAEGGDKYKFLVEAPGLGTGLMNTDIILDHIQGFGGRPIPMSKDGRMHLEPAI